MSQISFKQFYLNELLTFLWKQWSVFGVAGGTRVEKIDWIIDPEALLVFSLEITRYEPRLFDEILNWLIVNSKWIDIQRLRGIVKNKDKIVQQLSGAMAGFLAAKENTYRRKWASFANEHVAENKNKKESLFITKEGKFYPTAQERSKSFSNYGFIREEVQIYKKALEASVAPLCNVRILLRALFSIGSRSECILYLLTHESGQSADTAEAIGRSVRGTQDNLVE